jgi:hypothetical protein
MPGIANASLLLQVLPENQAEYVSNQCHHTQLDLSAKINPHNSASLALRDTITAGTMGVKRLQ